MIKAVFNPFSGNIDFLSLGNSSLPLVIDDSETYFVLDNRQYLFTITIEINGLLEIEGILVEV
jgi:hypothetical protein